MNKETIISDFVPGIIAGTINALVCIVSALALGLDMILAFSMLLHIPLEPYSRIPLPLFLW